MCVVCACEFDIETPQMVGAAFRLVAAHADENKAVYILEHLGFHGLHLMSNGEGVIRYKYDKFDEAHLTKLMGKPKDAIKAGNIRYPYGEHGLLAVWPDKNQVLLRNTKTGKEHIELPPVLQGLKDVPKDGGELENQTEVPTEPLPQSLPKAGTENDDDGVPPIHISEAVHREYQKAQRDPSFRLKFMHDLWEFLNHSKFGGHLKLPKLAIMRNVGVQSGRSRGYWEPATRTLKIAPYVFNASQNFFVEIFLHEMCHEAVTENWASLSEAERRDNNKNSGHGRAWAAFMKKVGLNPLRYDKNEKSVYMTEEEKVAEQELKNKADAFTAMREKHIEDGLKPIRVPVRIGQPVLVMMSDGKLERGVTVIQDPKRKKDNVWAVISKELADAGYRPGHPASWWTKSPKAMFYDPQDTTLRRDDKFIDLALLIKDAMTKKKGR